MVARTKPADSASHLPAGDLHVTARRSETPLVEQLRLNGMAFVAANSQVIGITAVALALARAGATVAIAVENGDELTQLDHALRNDGRNAYPVRCVMNDTNQMADVRTGVIDALGQIDILVWMAEELPFTAPYFDEQWEAVVERVERSLAGFACTCNQFAAHMASRSLGSVIVVTNPPIARPWPDITARAASFALIEVASYPRSRVGTAWSPSQRHQPAGHECCFSWVHSRGRI